MPSTARRVTGGSIATFLVVFAFLAGRMQAGSDPGLAGGANAHASSGGASRTSGSGSSAGESGSGSTDAGSGSGSTDPYAGSGSTGSDSGTTSSAPLTTHSS
ncbi:MAG: hypothetical protein ACJ760_06215 [Thermoleophilaceae bacterium]